MSQTSAIAMVNWQLGQILLPDHLRALEGSLIGTAATQIAATGLPHHGLARLEWSGARPAEGLVEVHGLVWIRRDGEVIAVPGNARLAQPLDLGQTGAARVDVYLHLLAEVDVSVPAGTDSAAGARIPRVARRLMLSADSLVEGSVGFLHLGRFEKQPGGAWALTRASVPPLVQVGPTDYFIKACDGLRAGLEVFESTMKTSMGDSRAPLGVIGQWRAAWISARQLRVLLDDMLSGAVGLHPYMLFNALRAFAFEIDLLDPPVGRSPRYAHDDLATCLWPLIDRLSVKVRRPPTVVPTYRFGAEPAGEGTTLLMLEGLSPTMLSGQVLYVLVQRPTDGQVPSLERAVLAAPSRITTIVRRQLRPVKLVRASGTRLGAWIDDVYDAWRIAPGAPTGGRTEWDHILHERALALLAEDMPPDTAVFLYPMAPADVERGR